MRAIGKYLLVGIVIAACGCMSGEKKDTALEISPPVKAPTTAGDVTMKGEADKLAEVDKLISAHEGNAGNNSQAFKDMAKDMATQETRNRQVALDYVRRGDLASEKAEYDDAISWYNKALAVDPNLTAARNKLANCEALTGQRRASISQVMEEMIEYTSAENQARLHDIDRAIDQSLKEMGNLRFDQAEFLLLEAQAQLALMPPALDATQRRQRIEQLLVDVKAEIREAKRLTKAEQESQVKKAIERDTAFRKQLTEERIKALLQKAHKAYQLQDYEQCIQISKSILQVKQRQLEALQLLRNAEKQEKERWAEWIKTEDKEQYLKTLEMLDDSSVPNRAPFEFPDKDYWQNRVQKRVGDVTLGQIEDSMEIREIKQILNTDKINLDFDNKPLSDVVDFIKTVARINIHIDRDVDPEDAKVTLNLRDIKLKDALEHIMINTDLAYTFRNNLLVITNKANAKGRMIFRIYNVTDILSKIRDFPGPELKISTPDEEEFENQGGGDGFSFVETDEATTLSPDALKELIEESTGGSDVWVDEMTIETHRGQLLVTATPEIHVKVKKVLDELRQDSDLFVVVRARFVDIFDDFLEDIGIDYRNLGQRNTPWPDKYEGRIHNNRTGGQDVGFTQSINNTENPELIGRMQHMLDGFSSLIRGDRVFGGPGGLSGLTLQFMMVDPYQLNAILRAVQEESQVRSVIAPEVTAHNGQRVFVSVITQRSYIADYELVSGGTTWTLTEVADPIVEVNEEGVVLDVRPTVSADRKYITIDVKPTLATLIGGVISTVLINLGTVMAAAMQVPIGLPKMSIQRTWTSVTVPNGGTVLLGGFRSMDHKQYVSSIPIIGKIPLLNLLVSRKGDVMEKRSLIILLTARLVDLRKEESERFGK